MIDNKVMSVVQPDLNYNGGFIRAARVARMARKESWYAPNFEIKNGVIPVPTEPGMGLEFDPEFLKKCTVVKR
jgi:L-alanine-DL-glutamate epimerase-like enolase superfamily enzyme